MGVCGRGGADRKVLLRLYRTLIRSKLDYSCIVHGAARQSYKKRLDIVHNQGIPLCLGAFRKSPVQSLYVEASEPSLGMRTRLFLQYCRGGSRVYFEGGSSMKRAHQQTAILHEKEHHYMR